MTGLIASDINRSDAVFVSVGMMDQYEVNIVHFSALEPVREHAGIEEASRSLYAARSILGFEEL